jgi:hypothetical protein
LASNATTGRPRSVQNADGSGAMPPAPPLPPAPPAPPLPLAVATAVLVAGAVSSVVQFTIDAVVPKARPMPIAETQTLCLRIDR